ncbi:MAG: hypothetical protein HN889_08315 [Rhodospirillaceae bacterium]|jgi:hypothetical protein|nr:hypothetical protein [Rhodospirillaceae bacterium]
MHAIISLITLGLSVALFLIWWVNRSHSRKKARLHQEIRDISSAEKDKQFLEAREKGDFDKWG